MTTLMDKMRADNLTDTEMYVLVAFVADLYGDEDQEPIAPQLSKQKKREHLGELRDDDEPKVRLLMSRFKLTMHTDLERRKNDRQD